MELAVIYRGHRPNEPEVQMLAYFCRLDRLQLAIAEGDF